jgi:acyl-CoA thioesterase
VDAKHEPSREYLDWIQERIDTSPFHSWAGVHLTALGDGTAEVSMPIEEHHRNPYGIVHGGMLSSMADAAIGIALRTQLRPGYTHVTAQLDVHYLSMAREGTIIAKGTAVHLGNKMGYGEADVLGPDGELLARSSATFIVLPPREGSDGTLAEG